MWFIELVNDIIDELVELLLCEYGKMLVDVCGDVQCGIEVIEFCLGIFYLFKGEYIEGVGFGIDVYLLWQFLGVVVGIILFNFLVMILLWKVGLVLVCGNVFVFKLSECDLLVLVRLVELFIEVGLLVGVFQVVYGDKEVVDVILYYFDIKVVGFVGSLDIVQYIYVGVVVIGKWVQCFGGVKNYMIVMFDVDLDQVVDVLIGVGYGSVGECCMVISVVVLVGDQIVEWLCVRLIEWINNLWVGYSLDFKVDYGLLVIGVVLVWVCDYIGQGVVVGVELVVDGCDCVSDDLIFGLFEGDVNLEGGFFIGLILFDYVVVYMLIYIDEIFGLVLCMVCVCDYEEVLWLLLEYEYGNGVVIFICDGDVVCDFVFWVQVGMVGVNVLILVLVVYYIFGGWKCFGFGDFNQYGLVVIQFYIKVKIVML